MKNKLDKNGNKTGLWEWYHSNGQLLSKVDYIKWINLGNPKNWINTVKSYE